MKTQFPSKWYSVCIFSVGVLASYTRPKSVENNQIPVVSSRPPYELNL